MGIARGMIKLLIREAKRERFKGVVATMGRQDVYATSEDLNEWSKEMCFQLTPGIDMTVSGKKEYSEKGYITDSALFQSLGFDKVESVDYSNFEQCTIVQDLSADIPAELYDKYDLIYDGGTSEHIFNIPKVMANYNKMLKAGGRIIHASPSSNYVDHGFYMFSPTLFYDYYSANKWNIIDSLFIESKRRLSALWNIYDYTPNCLEWHSAGGLKNKMYGIFFVAQKTVKSTYDAPFQQGFYIKVWDDGYGKNSLNESNSLLKKIAERAPESIKNILRPLFYQLPLKFSLKLIDRY